MFREDPRGQGFRLPQKDLGLHGSACGEEGRLTDYCMDKDCARAPPALCGDPLCFSRWWSGCSLWHTRMQENGARRALAAHDWTIPGGGSGEEQPTVAATTELPSLPWGWPALEAATGRAVPRAAAATVAAAAAAAAARTAWANCSWGC